MGAEGDALGSGRDRKRPSCRGTCAGLDTEGQWDGREPVARGRSTNGIAQPARSVALRPIRGMENDQDSGTG